MLKRIFWIMLALVLVLAALATTIASIGDNAEPLPPLDPDMLISMPDGSERPLSALVVDSTRASGKVEVVETSNAAAEPVPSPKPGDKDFERLMMEALEEHRQRTYDPDENDLFSLAEYRLQEGDVDEALALLRSIPSSDRRYARAQRRIGWRIMTKIKGEPHRGLSYVHECLKTSPLDGNAWQDAARVWGNSLGLPID